MEFKSGWQPPKYHDFRDKKYMAPAMELPAKVNNFQPSLGPPFEPAWNQGNIGSCGPHALAADIVFSITGKMPSRLFIYYIARMLMNTVNEDSGVDNRTMFKALARYGWCDEELWPYDPQKFKERPPKACFDQAESRAGLFEYYSVNQDLNTMRACLANKDPFVFGFTVYSSFLSVKNGDVPMPRIRDAIMGGHDILIGGYDDATQYFDFKNSYGPSWGNNGYGRMPYAFATNSQLSSDFWSVKLKNPVPPGPIDKTITIRITGSNIEIPGYRVTPLVQ